MTFSACTRTTPSTASSDSSMRFVDTSSTVASVHTDVADSANWQYKEEEDKMNSKKVFLARTESNDPLIFKSPYDGGSIASLCIRNQGGQNNVYLTISTGQFTTHSSDGKIRVRFDKTPVQTYETSESSDGSSNVKFIEGEGRFISNLKKHDKVIVEVEFYHEGTRQIEFNIANLKWKH